MDAARFRPVQFRITYPISLVKFDFETSPESICLKALLRHAALSRYCAMPCRAPAYVKNVTCAFPHPITFPYFIIPASTTLATIPAMVDKSAPVKVYFVFVTFAARKYTLMV